MADSRSGDLFGGGKVVMFPPVRRHRYTAGNPALRSAQFYAQAMVSARGAARKRELYLRMMASILAKDGV
jgi:hypothetical protein